MLATCLSIAALPVLVGELRDHRDERPAAVAAVSPGGELAGQLQSSPETEAPSPTTTQLPNGFLSGPAPSAPAPVITIAKASPPPATSAAGTASFKRWAPGTVTVSDPCTTPAAPVGTRLTVTNLDNGHVTACTVVARPVLAAGQVLVLDAVHFEQLADLGEAPIPVRIVWK